MRSLDRQAIIPFSGIGGESGAGEVYQSFINTPQLVNNLTLTLNDSPYAGQRFDVTNMFYRFPKATKLSVGGAKFPTVPWEFQFLISASIDGVLVAEQKILETQTREEQEQRQQAAGEPLPFFAVGSLEPFLRPTLHAGQSLVFALGLSVIGPFHQTAKVTDTFGQLTLGAGQIVVNYERVVR